MENIKFALSNRAGASPQGLLNLLECLKHPSFDLHVYICSVGGVGSTELGNFLTRHGVRCNLLTDADACRHAPTPPIQGGQLASTTRVVYLFGDPLPSIASHFRRGHALHQAMKTSGNLALSKATFPASLDEYVARGEDLFGYEAHLHNWLSLPCSYDILFVRYETLFDAEVALRLMRHACDHVKAPDAVAAMAAEWAGSRRERSSTVTEQQRRSMYVELQQFIEGLPACFLKTAGTAAALAPSWPP